MWGDLYKANPGYVLGFHGCDATLGEAVLRGKKHLQSSNNPYDWLGSGIYFWEGSPRRAMQWAEDAAKQDSKKVRRPIKKPFVVGAVIDLGNCCNLFDSEVLKEVKEAFSVVELAADLSGAPMPENKRGPDRILRFRDCAVLEMVHVLRKAKEIKEFDVVRAAFSEGEPLYEGANLTERNHIQLAVRTKSSIKGYFRPIPADLK